MICSVRSEDFILHHSRALIWPTQKLLVVADIHLGKAQTFQKNGLWLPQKAHGRDLDELIFLTREYQTEHVLFLGDFIHSTVGITDDVISEFKEWQNDFQGKTTVIIGNHDRPLLKHWPKDWKFINLIEELKMGDFKFQHEPPSDFKDPFFTWCGHIHPKISLRQGPENIRLPAFVITKNVGYLPAYSRLAGGANFSYSKKNRYFVTAETKVMEVTF